MQKLACPRLTNLINEIIFINGQYVQPRSEPWLSSRFDFGTSAGSCRNSHFQTYQLRNHEIIFINGQKCPTKEEVSTFSSRFNVGLSAGVFRASRCQDVPILEEKKKSEITLSTECIVQPTQRPHTRVNICREIPVLFVLFCMGSYLARWLAHHQIWYAQVLWWTSLTQTRREAKRLDATVSLQCIPIPLAVC